VQKMTKRKMDAVREAERCGHGRRSEVNISRRGAHRRDGIGGSGGEASLPRRQYLSMRLLLIPLPALAPPPLRTCQALYLALARRQQLTVTSPQVCQICTVAYFVASRQSCLQCTSQVSHIHLCCALSMYRLLSTFLFISSASQGWTLLDACQKGTQLCVALMEKGSEH
jgi:hypothetical protein